MSDLKPCPFCGGEASDAGYQLYSKPIPDMTWDGGDPITESFFCNCIKCGVTNAAGGVGYRTQAYATAAWNRRTVDPAAIREAALREAEKALRDWQDALNANRFPEAAITAGVAADAILDLIDKPGDEE